MTSSTPVPARVAVAFDNEPDRRYLYRPGELLVASGCESYVYKDLERIGVQETQVLSELDVVLFRMGPAVDIPALVDDLLAKDDGLEVLKASGITSTPTIGTERSWPRSVSRTRRWRRRQKGSKTRNGR